MLIVLADFTNSISLLPSNYMEEIAPNPESLKANTWSLESASNS